MDITATKILKQTLVSLLEIILKIINCSLRQGVFVSSWKCAIDCQMLTKSGMDLISRNCRPVSNLVFVSKVLEKVALQQFSYHSNNQSLFPDYQNFNKWFPLPHNSINAEVMCEPQILMFNKKNIQFK